MCLIMSNLQSIPTILLEYYEIHQPMTLSKHFSKLKSTSEANLSFYNTISCVYSSMIEGSRLEVGDYLKIHESQMNNSNKDYNEVSDLIKSYEFAQNHTLNLDNFLKIHEIATQSLISDSKYKGKLRDKNVAIYSNLGEKVYDGCSPEKLEFEMKNLFNDISYLKEIEISLTETFYFASMIHLVFVNIHPFADGNGRTARLLGMSNTAVSQLTEFSCR